MICPNDGMLRARIDNELIEADLEQITQHLGSCAASAAGWTSWRTTPQVCRSFSLPLRHDRNQYLSMPSRPTLLFATRWRRNSKKWVPGWSVFLRHGGAQRGD